MRYGQTGPVYFVNRWRYSCLYNKFASFIQVVGVSDERLGEEICAAIRLREGSKFTLDDVSRHLSGRIAKFKIPRILKIVDEFPKTASGKIQKYKLKEIIESGKI